MTIDPTQEAGEEAVLTVTNLDQVAVPTKSKRQLWPLFSLVLLRRSESPKSLAAGKVRKPSVS